LLAGTMAYDGRSPVGNVYAVGPDLQQQTVLSGITASNGVDFSPDHSRMYYVDTVTGRVDVFDVVDGAFHNRRPFVTVAADRGLPDGMTVDSEGGVWVALWGSAAVHRYSSEG